MFVRELFSEKEFWKITLRLAVPVALQNLLMSSASMVDSIMVGQLGETAIASVSMAGQWSSFFNMMLAGFSSGGAVFVAQYWGAKDINGIRRTYGMLLSFTLLLSLVYLLPALLAPRFIISMFTPDEAVVAEGAMYLTIVSAGFLFSGIAMTFNTVLRSTESVKLPMAAGMISVGVNVVLNYILIFGRLGFPGMGLRGAAIATFISLMLTPAVLLTVSIKKKNILLAPISSLFRFSRDTVGKFVRISIPVVIGEVLWAGGTMVYFMMYGRLGTNNVAALSIANAFQGVAFVFFAGLCTACGVIVGKSVGAHKIDQAKLDSKRFAILVPSMTIFTGVLITLLRAPITSLFNVSPDVRHTASQLIAVYALLAFTRIIPYITMVGIFRAGGDTKTGTVIDVGCLWIVGLPVTALAAFVFNLPFTLVYAVMIISENAPKTVLCIRHYTSDKWIKPVTLQN